MRLCLLTVLIAAATCHAQTATPNSAAASESAAATSTAPEPSAIESKSKEAVEEKEFTPPLGFKARKVDGVTMYCKKTQVTGTRFPKQLCLDEAGLKQYESNSEAVQRDVAASTRVCGGPGAVCGGN
jgi:hypothetical protein